MEMEGVFPNAITYACILKACCNIPDVHRCQETYSEIAKEGFEKDASISTILVDMYAKCGLLAEAHEVMCDMEISEASSWTALIAGYVEHGFGSEALACFEQMEGNGILASNVSYTCVLKACGSTGGIEKGRETHSNISVRGLETDLLVGSTIVDMYIKCGSLDEALDAFEKLSHRDVVAWNALLGGFSSQGNNDVLIMILDKMMEENIQPDRITFLCILFVCSHSGLVQEGLMLFGAIERGYGVIPCLEHCNSMIDLLMRIGQHSAAVTLLDNMPFQPDLVTLTTFVGSCHKKGHTSISVQAAEYAGHISAAKVASFRQIV
jgi:pentatricopeptide repeat protein